MADRKQGQGRGPESVDAKADAVREREEPQTEQDARVLDAEAVEHLVSEQEAEKEQEGQGEFLPDTGLQHPSSVDPNRALDLPPHRVSGDMKADAAEAYSVSGSPDPKEPMGTRPDDAGSRISGQAAETPKGEQNPK